MRGRLVGLVVWGLSVMLAAEVVRNPNVCSVAVSRLADIVVPHRKHSAETLRKWKDWGAKHPHWHPMSRDQAESKINFACQDIDGEFPTASQFIPEQEPSIILPQMALDAPDDVPGPEYTSTPVEDEPVATDNGYPLPYYGFTTAPGGGGGLNGGGGGGNPGVPAVPESPTLTLFAIGIVASFFRKGR